MTRAAWADAAGLGAVVSAGGHRTWALGGPEPRHQSTRSGLLRSPLHWLPSRRVALISYTGRRSGRRFTIPVGYEMEGLAVTISVGSPDRKVWWRSLTGTGVPVELLVRGRRRTGHAVATRTGDKALVRVALGR